MVCYGKVTQDNKLLNKHPHLYEQWDFDRNKDVDIQKVSYGSNKKVWWKCLKHQHNFQKSIKNHTKSSGCPICSSRKLLVGFNDINTTNPKLASLMLNEEDKTKYMEHSNVKVDWKCSECGKIIKNKTISDIRTYGLSCFNCADGFSYPEKVMRELLKCLGVDFSYDKKFDWSMNKRYDFYIKECSTIIEMHGKQHYNGGFSTAKGSTLKEEQINDKLKIKLAKENGIRNYIVVNSSESNISFIKKNILKTEIVNLFNLEDIDWNYIEKQSVKSISWKVLELWKQGYEDIEDIAKKLTIHREMVRRYLKSWSDIGECDFNDRSLSKRKVLQYSIDGKILIKEWESMSAAKRHCGVKGGLIFECLHGLRDDAYGYKWVYKEKDCIRKKSSRTIKKIVQLTIEGEYLNTFDSSMEAGKSIGVKAYNKILLCCKKERNSCGGYKWLFEEEYKKKPNIKMEMSDQDIKNSGIVQLSLQGEYLNTFKTASEANRYITGKVNNVGNIHSACKGKYEHSLGYKWEYKYNYLKNKN